MVVVMMMIMMAMTVMTVRMMMMTKMQMTINMNMKIEMKTKMRMVRTYTLGFRVCRCRNKQWHDLKQTLKPNSTRHLHTRSSSTLEVYRLDACSVSCSKLNTKVSVRHDNRGFHTQSFLMKI